MAAHPPVVMDRAKQVVSVAARQVDVSAAFLFGSQVNGTADQDSDLDIALFVPGVETWDFVERVDTATDIQMELASDVELHFFPADELEHPRRGSFAAYVQEHGVPIELPVSGRAAERPGEYETPGAES
ncbi:MAG: nucleotidyltransferase domain-containing protein [Planctomycetota bacterium]